MYRFGAAPLLTISSLAWQARMPECDVEAAMEAGQLHRVFRRAAAMNQARTS